MRARFGSSTRVLCAVEFSIAVVNILICFLLRADISESIYSFQRVALGLGIPIRWLYALGAFLVLFIPCFLMGTTIPLASEVCQRELGSKDPNVLNRLYALNTFGSVVGSLVGLAVLVPHFGQSKALLAAAALNCFAGVTLLFMPRKDGSVAQRQPRFDCPRTRLFAWLDVYKSQLRSGDSRLRVWFLCPLVRDVSVQSYRNGL